MRPIRARATVVSLLLTVTAVAAVGFASPALAQTLRPGSSGPAVSCWQKKLRWVALARPASRVPLISVNARYDSPTTNATKAFQRAEHLSADGVAGDRTQTQMLAELGTAARDKGDQYASALYYGRCSTPEPMVCRKVNGAPKIVKNPNDSNPQSIRYYYSVGCTHLDSGLTDQTAVLYLIDPHGAANTKTYVRRTGLRQTAINLNHSVIAANDTYRAVQGIALNGNVSFVSAPGCRRASSSQIVCQWTSAPYTVSS